MIRHILHYYKERDLIQCSANYILRTNISVAHSFVKQLTVFEYILYNIVFHYMAFTSYDKRYFVSAYLVLLRISLLVFQNYTYALLRYLKPLIKSSIHT